jgi:hypothetical protein
MSEHSKWRPERFLTYNLPDIEPVSYIVPDGFTAVVTNVAGSLYNEGEYDVQLLVQIATFDFFTVVLPAGTGAIDNLGAFWVNMWGVAFQEEEISISTPVSSDCLVSCQVSGWLYLQ